MTSIDRFGVNWQGRRVAVLGLGKSGLAAARLLQRAGCRVRVSDARDTEELRRMAGGLREAGVEELELGGHSRRIVDGCEAVIVSPGIAESLPYLRQAVEQGASLLSEIELAFRFCASPVVAVTGTNGKSSVVTLLQRVLTAAGRHAVACGNLGVPFAEVLPALTPRSIAVVEVSSFQLLGCREFRPFVGVLLNLGTNHLDRHPDRAHYIAAKARLFARQTPEDYAVLNGADAEIVALGTQVYARRVWFGANQENPPQLRLDPVTCRALAANLQAVLQVGRILDVPDPLTSQVIRQFRGLEHRLEHVGTLRGVTIVNDSKSTTPESLLYALARCPGSVVPIIGGRDKGLDFRPLTAALAEERVHGIVLIGESRRQLHGLLNGRANVRECATLEAALDAALELAPPGDTVLFSPACASFDMFKNFEERGQVFKQLVRQRQAPAHD
jgi:UDP-N-acetylmuramoylalanine--D-glutamate ligase